MSDKLPRMKERAVETLGLQIHGKVLVESHRALADAGWSTEDIVAIQNDALQSCVVEGFHTS